MEHIVTLRLGRKGRLKIFSGQAGDGSWQVYAHRYVGKKMERLPKPMAVRAMLAALERRYGGGK